MNVHIAQYSNELNTPVYVSAKCKQMQPFNIYTLNSLAYVGIAGDCYIM